MGREARVASVGSVARGWRGKKARVFSAAGELVRELPPQAGTVMDLAWRPRTNHLTVLAYGAATTYDPLTGDRPGEGAEMEGLASGDGVVAGRQDPRPRQSGCDDTLLVLR